MAIQKSAAIQDFSTQARARSGDPHPPQARSDGRKWARVGSASSMPGRAHSGAPEPVAGGLVVAWLLPVGNKSGFHPGDVRAMFGIRSTDATRSGAMAWLHGNLGAVSASLARSQSGLNWLGKAKSALNREQSLWASELGQAKVQNLAVVERSLWGSWPGSGFLGGRAGARVCLGERPG